MDRENLEQAALEECSAELFYELTDNLEITTDDELKTLLDNKGFL